MIKHIHPQFFLSTPFVATKTWELYNIENQSGVLLEPELSNVPISDTNIALDYIDYAGTPLLNRDCDIALEQQDNDLAIYEEGIRRSGVFDSEIEELNDNGTYKRLLYDQINMAFYNEYRNPLQIFGMENIDFPLSQMNRFLTNEFLIFSIPRRIMGDRLLEGSIQMYDNLLDDNVSLYDDSNGNLHAGFNLFSRIQEIRSLGNVMMAGTASHTCSVYSE